MNIYISGISGTGMGPLALMAKQAGFTVWGSDLAKGAIYDELINAGIEVYIGEQDGEFLREKLEDGVDWYVYTSALPENHPELILARKSGVKCTKRDDFTAFLVSELGLKMIAVAGTHGKTTTTAMIIWASLQMKLPISYIVGTTLGFTSSGSYKKGDEFFVYEADEYDRNFLKYHPWLAVIPSVSYDHPDIYKTKVDYLEAFSQFENQSKEVIKTGLEEDKFNLAGAVRRIDAGLAAAAILKMSPNSIEKEVINILNRFPGVGRRFERLADGLYTDYAHHPEEIAATLEIAKEENERLGKNGVVAIYEPHQNSRQHEVRDGYRSAFKNADKLFWLPTYLTRENENLKVLKPADFIKDLENIDAVPADLNDSLKQVIKNYLKENYLVLLMTAGPADAWLRDII